MKPILPAILAAAAVGAGLYWYNSGTDNSVQNGAAMVAVTVPELDATAKLGKDLFNTNCADCHGADAAGQNGVAPPLIHKIYEPNHHGDISFFRAVKLGVRAHHWPFGDMPPVGSVSEPEVERIVAYIRTLQRANGIY